MNSINKLIRKRAVVKGKLTNISNFLTSIENIFTSNVDVNVKLTHITELNIRYQNVQSLLAEFNDIQTEIEEICEDFDEQLNERTEFETKYYNAVGKAQHILNDKQGIEMKEGIEYEEVSNQSIMSNEDNIINPPSQVNLTTNIKLPQIRLPEFEGSYNNWLEFRDTFKSLIHDNIQISEIQKFHYLRASLKGNAAQVIHSLEFSSANYNIAWVLLCERYNNESVLRHTHVKALFNLPNIVKESSNDLRNLIDMVSKNLRSLQLLNQPVDQWDTLIIFMITGKLDKVTAQEWEEKKKEENGPTLRELKEFLRAKADLLETLEIGKQDFSLKPKDFRTQLSKTKTFLSIENRCVICKEEHKIFNCKEFIKLPINERYEKVKKLRLCINCLRGGHISKDCKSGNCRKCLAKHNTLLHRDQYSNITSNMSESKTNIVEKTTTATAMSNQLENLTSQVLLSTAMVQISDKAGYNHICRVLMDSGSQSNFISSDLCRKLNLREINISSKVMGINQVSTQITKACEITIQSCHNAYEIKLRCLILNKITDDLPNQSFDIKSCQIPPYIKLADPSCNVPGKIDLLIGSGKFWELLCIGQHKLGPNLPILQKTKFGWVLAGAFEAHNIHKNHVHCALTRNVTTLQEQIERFWSIEEILDNPLSDEETKCEELFTKTITRNKDGRFIVTIPLKEAPSKLGDSKLIAIKRLQSVERKFNSNNQFKDRYIAFMEEYEKLNHMTEIKHADKKQRNYLPHHGVLNEESITTKLRVVFDGSALTESGLSFNEIQYVGPRIQDELLTIMLRFRQHKYIINADINKMYRQMLVDPEQRYLQCILWRQNPMEQIKTYELNTVTYGTAAAPYLAVRCLKQLSIENSQQYPKAAEIIAKDFYVDDLLTGGDDIKEIIQQIEEVNSILKSAGFELRKWVTNYQPILEQLGLTSSKENINLGEKDQTKTLGVYWSSKEDVLMFKIKEQQVKFISKRQILSEIAQIFDPLGLLSPCIITAKIILQKLWIYKLSWDETVPQDIHTQWQKFREQLTELNKLKIPRHVRCVSAIIQTEIHGFADSSQEAYGACVYIRSISTTGEIQVHLLNSKTRVAPLKALTIPRLELCAALILAQLVNKVKVSLTTEFNSIYLWSDSSVVLHWIKMIPKQLQPFVSNRVAQIQLLTKKEDWKHVNTEDNPADLLSRGITPNQLINNKLWWQGPSWLIKSEIEWPVSKVCFEGETPEKRKNVQTYVSHNCTELFPFSKYSSLQKLKKIMVLCTRFIENCKMLKSERITNGITANQLNAALIRLVKISQKESFKTELKDLQQNKDISLTKSNLIKLNPFLDQDKIIRVGGRIQLSQCSFDKKHPMILAKNHHLTYLILKNEHERLGHAGPQMILSSIRDRFWPISGRNTIRKITHSCIRCFRVKPKVNPPIMGILPKARVTSAPTFSNTGVDYAGPFQIKDRKGRGCKLTKGYICLFVCMSTKAVHLELVSELSKDIFLAALRRFTSRRGTPVNIFSDNGSNFVAANKELKQFFEQTKDEIVNNIVLDGITWQFIPAHAPHFGGLWEAGVKSVKYHLKRLIGNLKLTFESFSTILIQIEGILNSRPLLPLSNDPNDLEALTPAHFLVGRRLTAMAEPDHTHINENRLSHFQQLQQIQQHFWNRWHKEYLSELQTRQKWNSKSGMLSENMLVVVKDDNLPPLCWKLGRVIKVFPGVDGVARVALVKTQNKIVKRAFNKLCPLPIEEKMT